MNFDPTYGAVHLAAGWVPSMRYLARRSRALEILQLRSPKTLLEVGCGAGGLLAELALDGVECTGLETSPEALQLARRIATDSGISYDITDQPAPHWQQYFAMVTAFDVLEHIDDDAAALRCWRNWVKPGGSLLISVPAHSHRWGPGDEWAGHFRRYDAIDLKRLISGSGFEIEHFECYGFPVANFTEWIGKSSYARMLNKRSTDTSRTDATALSGVSRRTYLGFYRYMRMPAFKLLLSLSFLIQKIFRNTDWGSGYLVLARKQ